MHPVGGSLRLARSDEDGAIIGIKKLEPGRDIRGVIGPWLVGNAEIGQDAIYAA